jgi:hypothetical protein
MAISQLKSKDKWRKRYLEYGREYYEKHREEILARQRSNYVANGEKYRKTGRVRYNNPEYYTRVVLDRCRQRAKAQGRPFTIGIEDIKIPELCPVLDVPLERNFGGKPQANSPSVDCIIPEKGYTPENIQVISYKANIMKNNATPEELVKFALWALNFHDIKYTLGGEHD